MNRWAAIYVIVFLFADFHIGLQEIAPQYLPSKPGRLERMGGWGTVRSPGKVLSTQRPRKESQRGRGRQRAKGPKSRIWERREAEGGVYPTARGAKWVEPQILGTGAIPQTGGGSWRSRPENWCAAAPHQQRALGPQQCEGGGSQLPARCGQLDHGRLELYPSHCRPVGEGRGKKGWQGAKVVAEYPTSLPRRLRTALHCGVEMREPLAQRGRRFPIPRKVRYRLSAALGLAQHNRAGSTGRDIGPGETHAIVCGRKETWP